MISYVPAAVVSPSLSLSLSLSLCVHARDFGDCLTRLSFFSFVSLHGKKRATHLSLVEIVKSAFGTEEVTEEICIGKNYRTEVSFTRPAIGAHHAKWRTWAYFVVLLFHTYRFFISLLWQ